MEDLLTKTGKRAIDTLMLNSPIRSSAGFLFGLVLFSFLPAFAPLIENSTQIDLAVVPAAGWVAAGILAFNIKNPKNKKNISKEAEETFDLIEEARRRGISEDELKMVYKLTCVNATKNIGRNKELEAEIERLKEQA